MCKQEKRIRILRDDSPESPRDWDNLGTMACWHSRYTLGDQHPNGDPAKFVAALPPGTVKLPLYLYDHSGLMLNTRGFSCVWDSGQVGYIYVTPERLEREKVDAETAKAVLEDEVETYSKFLQGEVWGYLVETLDSCSACGRSEWGVVDSCFGCLGETLEETGIAENTPSSISKEELEQAWTERSG